jgi:hypothetical protein
MAEAGFGSFAVHSDGKSNDKKGGGMVRVSAAVQASKSVEFYEGKLAEAQAKATRLRGGWPGFTRKARENRAALLVAAEKAVTDQHNALEAAHSEMNKTMAGMPRASRDLFQVTSRLTRYLEGNAHADALESLRTDARLSGWLSMPGTVFDTVKGGYGVNNVTKLALVSEALVNDASKLPASGKEAGATALFGNKLAEVVSVSTTLSQTLYTHATALEKFIDRIDEDPRLRRTLQREHGAQVVDALRTLWADLTSFLCEVRNVDGPYQRLVAFAQEGQKDPAAAMSELRSHMAKSDAAGSSAVPSMPAPPLLSESLRRANPGATVSSQPAAAAARHDPVVSAPMNRPFIS